MCCDVLRLQVCCDVLSLQVCCDVLQAVGAYNLSFKFLLIGQERLLQVSASYIGAQNAFWTGKSKDYSDRVEKKRVYEVLGTKLTTTD